MQMEVHVARCNMLCPVVWLQLFDSSHSFTVQILLPQSLVKFAERHFLVELTNRFFEHLNRLLTYEQDHEVLINEY